VNTVNVLCIHDGNTIMRAGSKGSEGERWLRYVVSTYGIVTMYPAIQLLHANKIILPTYVTSV
jgi:hypothetical protein